MSDANVAGGSAGQLDNHRGRRLCSENSLTWRTVITRPYPCCCCSLGSFLGAVHCMRSDTWSRASVSSFILRAARAFPAEL